MEHITDEVFKWLASLNPENLLVLTKIEKSNKTFSKENWEQTAKLSKAPGEFAMILILREHNHELIESGLICYGKKWEILHPIALAQLNKLQKKIVFAGIKDEYPECPVQQDYTNEEESTDPVLDAVAEQIWSMEWPEPKCKEQEAEREETIYASYERVLGWMEELPPTNLRADVKIGEEIQTFDKDNWHNILDFFHCADDLFTAEILIKILDSKEEQTFVGFDYVDTRWLAVAPECLRGKLQNLQPKNIITNYQNILDKYPGCPVSRN